MKPTILKEKLMSPVPSRRFEKIITDQALLRGLPLRHSEQTHANQQKRDWIGSFVWLRVPLLLLGIVGALGLLAYHNPRFAEVSRIINWPDRRISLVLLGIAGCVFFLLLIESLYVKVMRCIWAFQRRRDPQRLNWRSR